MGASLNLSLKENLNPKIWKADSLRDEVRRELLKIAEDFLDEDKGLVQVLDVILTGSMANYNWSESSDIDLHLIVDFGRSCPEVKKAYFEAKKKIWNDKHEILIHGFPVEIYVQDKKDKLFANGIFSLEKNQWITKPSKEEDTAFDMRNVMHKAGHIASMIANVQSLFYRREYKKAYEEASELSDRLRRMRRAGLEKGGEYSIENLAFKYLRRSGGIDRLKTVKNTAYDKMMSL